MAELVVQMAGAGVKRVRLSRRHARNLLGLASLGPSLVFLAAFTYWPTAQVIWQSLHAGSRRTGLSFATPLRLLCGKAIKQSITTGAA